FTGFSDSFNRFDFIIGGAFRARVRDAFDAWEAVLDIDFRQVGANRNAQIQLGFAEMDGPGGTLGAALTRFTDDRELVRAAIQMDVDEVWTADRDARTRFRSDPENFYAVFAHELGHALGIDHLKQRDTLMFAFTSDVTDLTLRDVRAGVSLYGPREGGGRPGPQILAGDGDGDRLRGGGGGDEIHGFGGQDRLFGGSGRDALHGGGGADRLSGGGGADGLFGGRGADRLDGGGGQDRLSGGAGADVFVLARGGGADRVTDFRNGKDKIEAPEGARLFVRDRGEDAHVALGGGVKLILEDAAGQIGQSDFIFA
ncbi:MAG: matrixin family metalloprotease, partial [Pseudomonadota bacterium]